MEMFSTVIVCVFEGGGVWGEEDSYKKMHKIVKPHHTYYLDILFCISVPQKTNVHLNTS